MPTYKTSYNGKTLRLTADTPEQAATAARLYFAGRGKADDVAAEANQQGQAAIRDKGLDDPLSPEFQALRERGEMEGTAAAAGPTAAILGAGAAGGLAPAGFIPGMLKDTAIYGAAEGAEKLLGLPSWTGELVGAVSPVKSLGKLLLGGAVGGAKKAAVGGAAGMADDVAKAAAAATRKAELDLATKEARLASITAKEERARELHQIRVEAARAKAAGKPGPRAVPKSEPAPAPRTEGATALKPEPEFIPDEAVSLVAEPLPFRPRPSKGTTTMATNLGGKAKPGPAATPDDELAATLQASIDAAKATKAGAVRGKGTPLLEEALDTASGMHQREATAGMTEAVAARRRAVGSQKVARELGMERHQVQSDAGTILNEALGEVSPVIPEKAWAGIVAKMKSLPPEERVAYVARARGVKNMAQIENLRRTLETLGLLAPVGLAVGAASSE